MGLQSYPTHVSNVIPEGQQIASQEPVCHAKELSGRRKSRSWRLAIEMRAKKAKGRKGRCLRDVPTRVYFGWLRLPGYIVACSRTGVFRASLSALLCHRQARGRQHCDTFTTSSSETRETTFKDAVCTPVGDVLQAPPQAVSQHLLDSSLE